MVPDVGAINLPGAQAETGHRHKGEQSEGVRGLKSLGVRDLHYRMAFLACSVSTGGQTKLGSDCDQVESADEMRAKMTTEEWEQVYKMSQDKNIYSNIINSLFPTIHGNDEVKRGIALMLFGGVPKTTASGTSLRGDINVCVVGDPSTAKSQFLKIVSDFCPRAVISQPSSQSRTPRLRHVRAAGVHQRQGELRRGSDGRSGQRRGERRVRHRGGSLAAC